MRRISKVTSFALLLIIFFGPLSRAQTTGPFEIQVRMVAGVDASYEAGSLQSTKLAVEVTDQAGVPLPGVAVTFRLPEEGATGIFPDGSRSAVIYTNEHGEAVVAGIRWGATPGDLSIRITAVKGSSHAGILARQELITGSAHGTSPSPAPSPTQTARAASTTPSAPTVGSKPTAAATPSGEARAASAPEVAAPRVTSQVTIVTPPAKPKPVSAASITPLPTAAETNAKEPPAVAISSAPPGHGSSSKTKWILLGLAAAGAAAGVAFAMGGSKSSTAPTPAPGTTIGAPSISIGHP